MRSQGHVADGHRRAPRFDRNVAMRGSLHRVDERLALKIAPQAAKLLGRNDDDFVAAAHGDMLRAFAPNPADEFAEARLGVLKQPAARELWRLGRGCFYRSIHADHKDRRKGKLNRGSLPKLCIMSVRRTRATSAARIAIEWSKRTDRAHGVESRRARRRCLAA